MEPEEKNRKIYEQAKKRAAAKLNFYKQAGSSLIITVILLAINLMVSPGKWWVVWPALGMGIALVFSAWHVFGTSPEMHDRLVEKEYRKVLEREQGKSKEK